MRKKLGKEKRKNPDRTDVLHRKKNNRPALWLHVGKGHFGFASNP